MKKIIIVRQTFSDSVFDKFWGGDGGEIPTMAEPTANFFVHIWQCQKAGQPLPLLCASLPLDGISCTTPHGCSFFFFGTM